MSEERRPTTVTLGAMLIAVSGAFLAGMAAGAVWEDRAGSYSTVDECVLEHYAGGNELEMMALERRCEATMGE
ncbi:MULTISPECIES: hypothetical protein [unclassified Thioalkalivibrio]|uniref:hypothetical protein n=1 Tax=unclassified Thioalkalivibrio TaxID=2621013 RepID=UPI00036B603C|nr:MULTISPECIES: hypothetical protein [unclassified Thioalkalivibrio]